MALKIHNISKPLWEAEAKSTYIGEGNIKSSFEKNAFSYWNVNW